MKEDITIPISISILTVVMILFLLPISISELVIANTIANPLTCQPHDQLSPINFRLWLNVEGSLILINICLIIFILLTMYDQCMLVCSRCSVFIYTILFGIFNIAWLVIGAVAFWGHCNAHTGDYSVDCMMWTALIIGFIGIINGYFQARNTNREI
jgi:hypothetical protein